jgi:antitoxin PrlF
VVSWEHGGEVCCITLVKAAALTGMVHSLLSPMMEQLGARRSE